MTSLIIGVAVMAATLIAFWSMMPRNGKFHRFVGTELEPYIGVAFTAAVALSMTLLLSGVIDLVGNP